MSYSAVQSLSINIDGTTILKQETITSDNKTGSSPASVPAAKAGTLTTRTSDTVGTLTMASGHGINTADKIDIYWATGARTTVTAGTVSGDSVPFSVGAGDNLPIATTVVAVQKSLDNQETFAMDGDDLDCLVIKSAVPSTVRFLEADGTTIVATIPLTADDSTTPKYVYNWDGTGTNPLAGLDVGKIGFTHGSLSAQTGFLAVALRS